MGVTHVGKDYTRLLKFASVGLASGTAWNQRSFVVECQNLAANARWWQQFKILNIQIDDSLFRNDCYRRNLISEFLTKTNLDIMTVFDFANNYHIEGIASFCSFFC